MIPVRGSKLARHQCRQAALIPLAPASWIIWIYCANGVTVEQ
jgi:hypothetical protein